MNRQVYLDLEKLPSHLRLSEKKIKNLIQAKVKEIRLYFKKWNFKKAVVGVSGGIDSSLSACLVQRALKPQNVILVTIPYFGISEKKDIENIKTLAKNLKIPKKNFFIIPINKPCDASWQILKKIKGGDKKIRFGNIIARERAKVLFDIASAKKAIVVGAENKTEERLAYFTLGGDHLSGVEPILNLYKSQVYQLALFFKEIPEMILKKAPSAELWKGQTDEGELGISYLKLDTIISAYEDLKLKPSQISKKFKIPKKEVEKVIKMLEKAKGKRFLPYILKA